MTVEEVRAIIGDEALIALQESRAVLNIWRRSSPHNWWVEDVDGEMLWHSEEEYGKRRLPSLELFELVEDSPEAIGYWYPGVVPFGESRQTERSTYRWKGCKKKAPGSWWHEIPIEEAMRRVESGE